MPAQLLLGIAKNKKKYVRSRSSRELELAGLFINRASNFFTRFLIISGLFVVTLFAFPTPTIAQEEGNWYRDQDLRVSFKYSNKFAPEDPAELTTRFVVNWRARQSRGLIATCYLKAVSTDVDELIGRAFLESNADNFTESWVRNTQRRASTVEVIESRPIRIDGLQAIYIVMDTITESFDDEYDLRVHSIITFWEGHEVILECGSSIRSVVLGNLPDDQASAAIANVEDEIQRTLRSLHFQRH